VNTTYTKARSTMRVNRKRKPSDLEGMKVPKRARGPSASTSQDAPAQVGLASLPEELLVKIFSYLPTVDLHTTVSRVSKLFHRISQDPGANIAVQITRLEWNHEQVDHMLQFLERQTNIQDVELNNIEITGASKHSLVTYFRRMFKLAVLDQKMTKSMKLTGYFAPAFKLLRNRPAKAKQIQKFHLHFGDDYAESFGFNKKEWPLLEMTNMTEFKVTCSTTIGEDDEEDDEYGHFIIDMAMSSKKLESFSVDTLTGEPGYMEKFLHQGTSLVGVGAGAKKTGILGPTPTPTPASASASVLKTLFFYAPTPTSDVS